MKSRFSFSVGCSLHEIESLRQVSKSRHKFKAIQTKSNQIKPNQAKKNNLNRLLSLTSRALDFLAIGGKVSSMEEPILLIKEPIVIKALARQMGLRPPQIMKDLMELNIFTNINNTISRDVAASVLKKHGRKFAFLD